MKVRKTAKATAKTSKYTLRNFNVIHWHHLQENPNDIPTGDRAVWCIVGVVGKSKDGTGLSWGSTHGLFYPEQRKWFWYDTKDGAFREFWGEVVMWAPFPLDILTLEKEEKE